MVKGSPTEGVRRWQVAWNSGANGRPFIDPSATTLVSAVRAANAALIWPSPIASATQAQRFTRREEILKTPKQSPANLGFPLVPPAPCTKH